MDISPKLLRFSYKLSTAPLTRKHSNNGNLSICHDLIDITR